jgi:hypothetical protein
MVSFEYCNEIPKSRRKIITPIVDLADGITKTTQNKIQN